jgi:hypothetical protein
MKTMNKNKQLFVKRFLELEDKIKTYNEHSASTSIFMELVHKFTRIDELTHELVREFIEKCYYP